MGDFITIPARLGKEANLGYNDTWPGDLVDVHVGSLAREAARACAEGLVAKMDAEILTAFRAGKDYVVTELGPGKSKDWQVTFAFKGRWSEPGEFDEGLPHGWKLYRLKDWQDGKVA